MELRAKLGEILDLASSGERIMIERDHRPVAVLVDPEDAERLDESTEDARERVDAALQRLDRFARRMAETHPMPDDGFQGQLGLDPLGPRHGHEPGT